MTTIEILQGIKDWITTKLSKVVSVTSQTFTDAEKKQARANLGFGNGDIDNEPTAGSDNMVKSGGVATEFAKTPSIIDYLTPSDLDITDERGNVLARFENGHFKVKHFDSADALDSIQAILSNIGFDNIPEFNEEDYYAIGEIVKYGKLVYVFTSAHEAGEWDASEVEETVITTEHPVEVTNSPSEVDLDITDERGNILVRFANGHIKTKNFASENIMTTTVEKVNGKNILTFINI